MIRSCLLLACLLFAVEGRGQGLLPADGELAASGNAAANAGTDTDTPRMVFRSGVDLVALSVVVTDRDERFVKGLSADHFAVYEDGVRQDVSFFAAAGVPLDLAILLDTSASMTGKMDVVQEAARGFIESLRGTDRVTIVDIKDATRVLHPLDSDIEAARNAILGTTAGGGTALHNGLYLTLKELVRQRPLQDEVRRQAIVVLSDGADTVSLVSFDDVMEVAKESAISIYTISLTSPYVRLQSSRTAAFSQSQFAMRALAQETGARAFFPTDVAELAGVYDAITDELGSQYALGYTSKNPRRDGAFRKVIVRVTDHADVLTRTRAGYMSARIESPASLD